jgi:hypothetical protein
MHRFILGTSRRQLLAAGATAAAGLVATAAVPQARAALPPATPAGDDLGFLAFGAVAEGVLVAFFDAALAISGAWSAAERRVLTEARASHRANIDRLNTALGPDNAVTPGDFAYQVTVGTRPGALRIGRELETLVGGTYLGGVAASAPASCSVGCSRCRAATTRSSPAGPGRPRAACPPPSTSTRPA